MNTADFGVPQTRERLFLFATAGDRLPQPRRSAKASWSKAIEDFIPQLLEKRLIKTQLESLSKYNKSFPALIAYDNCCVLRESHEPSFTLTCSISHNTFPYIVYDKSGIGKKLNIKSLARLQTFPDDYQWFGRNRVDGKIIGNSVPPLMAHKIATSIKETLTYTI